MLEVILDVAFSQDESYARCFEATSSFSGLWRKQILLVAKPYV